MLYFLHHVPIVDSTNAYARTHWQHLSDRTCVYCDIQRAGRGRYGRTWLADERSTIAMTYVLKRARGQHDSAFQTWTALTQYAALILCRVLRTYGLEARIKWPNDVLVDGKKIAGILAEGIVDILPPTAGDIGELAYANEDAVCAKGCEKNDSRPEKCLAPEIFLGIVLGIGINVSISDENLQAISSLGAYAATSLDACIGYNVDRDRVLRMYNDVFFSEYEAFMETGFSYIYEEYMKFSYSLHQIVEINTPAIRLTGKVKGFTIQGELILIDLSDPLGTEHIFNSGELV